MKAGELARMRAELAAARKVIAIADEVCTAIDRASSDEGGSRPLKEILADLGPALHEYDCVNAQNCSSEG